MGLAAGSGQLSGYNTNRLLKGVEKKIQLAQVVDAWLVGLAGTEQLSGYHSNRLLKGVRKKILAQVLNSWLVGLAPGNGKHTNQLLKGVEKKIRLVQLVDARLLSLAGTEQLVLDACPIGLLG